jgi:hypothetical protein
MRTIKLMVDYHCFPLWEDNDGLQNLDHNLLPISDDLKISLDNWADKYDQTLNTQDPLNSGFSSKIDEESFKEEGQILFERLSQELGLEFKIILF